MLNQPADNFEIADKKSGYPQGCAEHQEEETKTGLFACRPTMIKVWKYKTGNGYNDTGIEISFIAPFAGMRAANFCKDDLYDT